MLGNHLLSTHLNSHPLHSKVIRFTTKKLVFIYSFNRYFLRAAHLVIHTRRINR